MSALVFILITVVAKAQTRYVDNIFKDIKLRTFNYAIKKSDTLKLDIYDAVDDSLSKKPLMVLVHGGGFYSGQRNDSYMISLAETIAKKGYVVASVDYRLIHDHNDLTCHTPHTAVFEIYKNSAKDVLDALLFLTDYKTDFRIDDSKIVLTGSSAGAETILNIAYNRDLITNSKRHKSIKIAGVVSISGALFDTKDIAFHNSVPGVFYHGEEDPVVPYDKGAHHSCDTSSNGFFILEGSKKIAEKLEYLDTSFMLYSYKYRGHDIFNLPNEDYHESFVFLKKVVFDNHFYQSSIKKPLR